MNWLISAPFIIPVLAISIILITPKNSLRRLFFIQILMTGAILLTSVLLLSYFNTLYNPIVVQTANWSSPYGISLVYDGLSTLMLFIFSLVGLIISLYSITDKDSLIYYKGLIIGYWLLFLGITGAILTADLFNLYVWYELMLVGAFSILSCSTNQFKQSLVNYAVINILGTLIILFAIVLIYSITGSLNYAKLSIYFSQNNQQYVSLLALTILMLGLFIKGAMFPMYFWLPKSYPLPSITATSLLASFVTKATFIVIIRLMVLFSPLHSYFITDIMVFIAMLTMILGGLGALAHKKLRNILSYHIISQLGFIALAISMHSNIALMAALFYIIHNIFVKSNLFFIVGYIEKIYGTDNLQKIGRDTWYQKTTCNYIFSVSILIGWIPSSIWILGKIFTSR